MNTTKSSYFSISIYRNVRFFLLGAQTTYSMRYILLAVLWHAVPRVKGIQMSVLYQDAQDDWRVTLHVIEGHSCPSPDPAFDHCKRETCVTARSHSHRARGLH